MTSRSSVLLFQYQLAPNSSTDNKFYWEHPIESERESEGVVGEGSEHSFVIRAMHKYIWTWNTNWLGATITHFIDSEMPVRSAHFI